MAERTRTYTLARPSVAALLLLCVSLTARAQVVISQVYGGGGNTGAALRNDFIELFNRGAATVDVTGWSVQYASQTGTSWQVTPLSGSIAAGRYYLVQEAAGAGGTLNLPAPDAAGSIAMSATAGKVALASAAQPLEGSAPAGTVDFFAYSGLGNSTAALRQGRGCAADFTIGAPDPRNSASPANSCEARPLEPVPLAIHDIQGRGTVSPFADQWVSTTGVVTLRKTNGFFLQAPETEADAEPETSEGLFVYTAARPPEVAAAGNYVRVSGTVAEFRPASDQGSPPLTELTQPVVSLIATGSALPAPVTLTPAELDPAGGVEQLERFEGMRVHVPALVACSGTDAYGVFFGVLEGVPRPFREPGIPAPDPGPSDAPRFDSNPERLRVAGSLTLTAGATVRSLTGPLDYGARTYTIIPETAPEISDLRTAQPVPAPGEGEFTVASVNLRRFTSQRLDQAAAAIRDMLGSPDVLGVQEVEDLATLQALAARLDGQYLAFLEKGNDPSGFDLGLLVKSSRVTVEGVSQEGRNEEFNDRPPLVLRARVAGEPVTVIVNHMRSRLDIEDPRVQEKRRRQAEYLAGLVQSLAAVNVVVTGDFNSFEFTDGYVDVMGIVTAQAGLTNLIETLEPPERYSYVYNGDAQALDHILVSAGMRARLTRFAYARFNADFPETSRLSDHDAPVAFFNVGK